MSRNYHKLSVVATPIGNLQEVSELAKKTLFEASTIICEDTRVTAKLLNLLKIQNHQKLVSYHKMNEQEKLEKVLKHLEVEPCVLVSDAGYPVISDPGFYLINYLRKQSCEIEIINGPCAIIHSIVGSGVDCTKFMFAGFLNKKVVARKIELNALKEISYHCAIIYYEPLNYLLKGLTILKEVFGDIKICIARELSKLNESFYFDKISVLEELVELRGEFVILIPKQEKIVAIYDLDYFLNQIEDLIINEKLKVKEACKKIAAKSQYKATELYKEYLNKFKNNNE